MLSLLQKLIDEIQRWQKSDSYKQLERNRAECSKLAVADTRDVLKHPEPLHDAHHQDNEGR